MLSPERRGFLHGPSSLLGVSLCRHWECPKGHLHFRSDDLPRARAVSLCLEIAGDPPKVGADGHGQRRCTGWAWLRCSPLQRFQATQQTSDKLPKRPLCPGISAGLCREELEELPEHLGVATGGIFFFLLPLADPPFLPGTSEIHSVPQALVARQAFQLP